MRICFHTHCFPDTLAPKAMAVLSKNAAAFGLTAHTDGTLHDAKRAHLRAGVCGALICSVATNPKQETKVNDFAISVAREKDFFFAAGSIHPDSGQKRGEFERLRAAGIKGIKIHPDYCGVEITDSRYDEVFALAEEFGFFVVTHAGKDPISPGKIHAGADALLQIKKGRPGLKLIAAHMGGAGQSAQALELLAGTDIMLDTSLSAARPHERENLMKILKSHDPCKILFGTDTPWSESAEEVRFLEESGLPEHKLERIFYRNAKALLGL